MPAMPMLRRNGTGSDDEREQRDADGGAAEDDGPAGVLHRRDDRGFVGGARAQPLLAPAHDDSSE